MTPDREPNGYALIAAVASIAFFASVALAVLTQTQRAGVAGAAEIEAARADAAAQAGVAIGVHDLLAAGRGAAARPAGVERRLAFDGATLRIVLTPERSRVPINLLDAGQMTRLLEYAGVSGDRGAIAAASLEDWIDDDDIPRPDGAEVADYRALGIRPRNAGLVTIGELGRVRGFTAQAVARIATVATTDFGSGPFDPAAASPAAIRIMYPPGEGAVEELLRSRERSGQRTAIALTEDASLVGRPTRIVVTASYPSGATGRRTCIAELTGASLRPVAIRHCT